MKIRTLQFVCSFVFLILSIKAQAQNFQMVSTVGLGDELTCLAISPKDPNFVLVGTTSGTIHRTIDGGATWREETVVVSKSIFYGRERVYPSVVRRSLPQTQKTAQHMMNEVLQKEENLEYALGLPGKSPHLQGWLRGKGLQTSGNNLQQFLVEKGDRPSSINWIDVDWNDDNYVYVATMDGLYRSTDRGRNYIRIWQGRSSAAERMISTVATIPNFPKRILLGTAAGVFYSEDRGISFRRDMNFYITGAYVRGLYVDGAQPGLVHMAMGGAAMATPDAGQNWITTYWHLWGPRSDVQWVGLGPDNIRLIGTRDGLWVSFQGGEMGTWERRGRKFVGDTVNTILPTQDPKKWYVTTPQALWVTEDSGTNWRKVFQTGGRESPRWIAAPQGQSEPIWLLTNRGVFRTGQPPGLEKEKARRRNPRLWDIPPLHVFWRRVQRHNQIYYKDNQNYRERAPFAALIPNFSVTGVFNPAGTIALEREFPHLHWDYLYRNQLYKRDAMIEVFALWDLGRLIFDRMAQPYFGRVERSLEAIRQDMTERVNRLYREYQLLAHSLAYAPPKEILAREFYKIRLQEISAYFDAVSGGFWSEATGGKS
ncbi:MAG: hypothetical protein V1754_07760 [Pseudomonadota bacterium]